MAFEVKGTTATSKETSSEIDLLGDIDITETGAKRIKRDVGELLIEETVKSLSQSKSPLSKGEWKSTLSKEYKKFKQSQGLPGKANMELTGEMLDALDFKMTDSGIKIGVFGQEAPRADGHNNLSGKSTLPLREFIPKKDQQYKRSVLRDIEEIIADEIARSAKVNKSDLKGVQSRSDLMNAFKEIFPSFTNSKILGVIGRSERIQKTLEDLNLLRFL